MEVFANLMAETVPVCLHSLESLVETALKDTMDTQLAMLVTAMDEELKGRPEISVTSSLDSVSALMASPDESVINARLDTTIILRVFPALVT